MARRGGDAEGRIARGAAWIWDGFDGNTAFEWLRAETRERPCCRFEGRDVHPKDYHLRYHVLVRTIFAVHDSSSRFGTILSYREKNNIARRFVRRIRTSSRRVRAAVRRPAVHEPVFRAITRDPCHHGHRDGARPSFTRTRTSRPARVPCRTSGFFSRLLTQAGQFPPVRVSGRGRAGRDAPAVLRAAGFGARRRVLRRDRTNPAADSLARPTFPSPPRSIPPRRHRHIVTHIR